MLTDLNLFCFAETVCFVIAEMGEDKKAWLFKSKHEKAQDFVLWKY